jgi:RimJ/RimL family protein N-acetyltransferase
MNAVPLPAIETPRLSLRPLCDDDEALYRDLYCDPDTMRHVGPAWSPERAARSFRATLASAGRVPPERVFLTIVERATKRSIGICGVARFDTSGTRAEAGILLVSQARAQGFAWEGLVAMFKQIFHSFPVDEIWAECAIEYPAVERLLNRLGFRPCDGRATGGVPGSKRIWSILRASWCYPMTITKRGEDPCQT